MNKIAWLVILTLFTPHHVESRGLVRNKSEFIERYIKPCSLGHDAGYPVSVDATRVMNPRSGEKAVAERLRSEGFLPNHGRYIPQDQPNSDSNFVTGMSVFLSKFDEVKKAYRKDSEKFQNGLKEMNEVFKKIYDKHKDQKYAHLVLLEKGIKYLQMVERSMSKESVNFCDYCFNVASEFISLAERLDSNAKCCLKHKEKHQLGCPVCDGKGVCKDPNCDGKKFCQSCLGTKQCLFCIGGGKVTCPVCTMRQILQYNEPKSRITIYVCASGNIDEHKSYRSAHQDNIKSAKEIVLQVEGYDGKREVLQNPSGKGDESSAIFKSNRQKAMAIAKIAKDLLDMHNNPDKLYVFLDLDSKVPAVIAIRNCSSS